MTDAAAFDRYCLKCRHSLCGIEIRRCPECGRAFDPENPRTTAGAASRINHQMLATAGRTLMWLFAIVGIVLFFMSAAAIAPEYAYILAVMTAVIWIPSLLALLIIICWPRVPLKARHRALAIAGPVLSFSILFTWWPMRASFLLHRPAMEALADQFAATGRPIPPQRVGLFHIRAVRQGPGNNIGFWISSDASGGIRLVRTDGVPRRYNWYNTNWEVDLGGNWYYVFED